MEILTQKNNETYFSITNDTQVSVLNIDKVSLFTIMNNLYKDKDYYSFDKATEIIKSINNPVKQQIANQIIIKLEEFNSQIGSIKSDLTSKYPEIDLRSSKNNPNC